ncbi:unnamed protein product [Cercopithifilaria johnstoni]|uniref:Peptidase A1 domain-containing protein n=1 Tax=Cercopithifilaria johnstoni TaxID=2874296 RepID=A0A8J2M3Y5_9BILA|nr:unnamed protein product [Cercopithifilaria johnstoni]
MDNDRAFLSFDLFNSIPDGKMRDTLINLAIIFYCLQAAPIFVEHEVELHPVYGKSNQHTGYTAKVIIGESKEELALLLDIATTIIWIYPSKYTEILPENKQAYSFLQSETFKKENPLLLVEAYGSRSVALYTEWDKISLNLLDGTCLDFTDFPFCKVKIIIWPKREDYQRIDGLFGIGVPYGNSGDSSRNNQSYLVITVALPPLDSNKTAILTLGGRNNQSCDLNYETVEPLRLINENTGQERQVAPSPSHLIASNQSGNHYEFKYNSIKMGDVMSSIVSFAYLSTIEPFISVPDDFLSKIITNLNATFDSSENKYMVQCKGSVAHNTYEPFEISTDSNTYVIPPQHFIIKHNPDDMLCELAFRKNERIFYYLYASENLIERYSDIDPNIIVLGIPFFHQYCIMLKPRGSNINFAPII